MKKKLISALLCVSMAAALVAGCGSSSNVGNSNTGDDSSKNNSEVSDVASDDATTDDTSSDVENTVYGDASADDAFVVWGWNGDIKALLDGPFAEAYPDLAKRIVFVDTGGSDYYQTKLDEILEDPNNELYPDLMGLEVDYVLKYVNSDYLTNVADMGITASDYADQYQYNLDLGTDYDGNVRALFWQATPGSYQLRADLCEKFLGTTDPAELTTMFSTWDGILDAARTVNEASGGKCKLFSGYDECFRVLSNARATGWYGSDDVISVDGQMTKYMELAKTMVDEGLTFETEQWSTDWNANMEGDGETTNAAIAYCGCPWFTYWCLKDNWKDNTILVGAPEQFFWGGTGLAATADCADLDMAATIIKSFTCDKDFMVAINKANSDFVNNKAAVQEISSSGAASCDYLYSGANQDIMAFYLPLAENISADVATAEDQNINAAWATQVRAYASGSKDMDTAIADFKSAVHDAYSYLKTE